MDNWTMRDRVIAVLQGHTPDCHPFIDRMELWYESRHQAVNFPEKYTGMSLNEIHKAVGIGRQKFTTPYVLKLHGVEVVYTFEDEIIFRESEPVLESFPALWAPPQVPRNKAGSSIIEYIAPVGTVHLKYDVAESTIAFGGIEPYLTEHLIKEDADILHGQGKKVGSHTDGNLRPLLDLLAECGLDVCESFSPAPLTECTFEKAWQAWQDGPIIWGGIPSPILEERTGEKEFREYVQRLLEVIGARPIIIGVGDMVLGNNLIERVEYIATEIEKHRLKN